MKTWLLTADWHLGGQLRKSSQKMKKDNESAMRSLQSSLIGSLPSGQCVIAGDIFDHKRIGKEEIRLWREFVSECQDHNISVLYVPGNHEKDSDDSGVALPSAVHPWAVDISDGVYEVDGYRVQGITETSTVDLREQVRQVKPCDLLVLHAPFEHLFGFEVDNLVSILDVPAGVKNVLVGHIHQVDRTDGLASGGAVFSPGPLHATEITELGSFGVWTADKLDDPDDWDWEEVFCQPSKEFMVEDEASAEEVSRYCRNMPEWKDPVPLTILLKYTTEARTEALNVVREHKENEAVRFICSAVGEEYDDVDLSQTVDDLVSNDLFGPEAAKEAFMKEEEAEDSEVQKLLIPALSMAPVEAREHLRQWAAEKGVQEVDL